MFFWDTFKRLLTVQVDNFFVYSILTSRRCRRPCRKSLRIRADNVFECWKEIPLADLVHGIYLQSNGAQISTLERIVNLPHKAAIKLCQKLRACCSSWLNRNPIVIGRNGLNYVVQIDESQLHHRQRVSICQSYQFLI